MLHRLGARRLVVVGVPPMGCMPLIKYLKGQKTCVDQLNQIAFSFNSKIIKNLELLQAKIGLKTIYVDAYSTIQEAIKTPRKFGENIDLIVSYTNFKIQLVIREPKSRDLISIIFLYKKFNL